MKGCLTSLENVSLNEIPLHTHWNGLKRMSDTSKCKQGCGTTETFMYLGLHWYGHFGKLTVSGKAKCIHSLSPAIALLGFYPIKVSPCEHQKV